MLRHAISSEPASHSVLVSRSPSASGTMLFVPSAYDAYGLTLCDKVRRDCNSGKLDLVLV